MEVHMKIIISNSSPTPIYEQIKNTIINQIISGELVEEEPLPSIRTLASDINISIMTIKKAYDELEKEGYIFQVQGKGSYVAKRNSELIKENALKEIENYLENAILLAKQFDVSSQEIIDLIKILMESDKE